MFGRANRQPAEESPDTPAAASEDNVRGASGKGRPTRSRKEAEEARRRALKGPVDPKARKKLERERARQDRLAAREALMAGDEKALPPRDAGPVRRHVRDFVDGRRTLAEFFIPLAVVVLLLGLFRNPTIQVIVSYIWFLMLLLLIVDMTILLLRLRSKLAVEFPDAAERKGAVFYGAMRALQIRRLRLPPPKVRAGGRPVTPERK